MKKILFVCLSFTIYSCKSENEIEKIKHYSIKTKHQYNDLVQGEYETFNIKRFDKNKDKAGNYIYSLNDGTKVIEYGNAKSGYFTEETPNNSLFVISKGYYINLGIRAKGITYGNIGCVLGIWYEFDENGNLIKETNYDKPFKIAIVDIIEFLKVNKADLNVITTSVSRFYDEETKKAKWTLIYRGKYKEKPGMFIIEIDDSTAEIVKVVKILGKEGEKEILFEK
ncbi:hypothetical protein AR687_17215 [Flavobacteriaceae bacterium CRH]|nr:hypothetical protein AR687_17215 [Flavobacteriaceae bacterium CRH]